MNAAAQGEGENLNTPNFGNALGANTELAGFRPVLVMSLPDFIGPAADDRSREPLGSVSDQNTRFLPVRLASYRA